MNRYVPEEVIPLKVARSQSLDLGLSEDESVVFIISSSPFPTYARQGIRVDMRRGARGEK